MDKKYYTSLDLNGNHIKNVGSLELIDDIDAPTHGLRILTGGNEVNVDGAGSALVLRVFDNEDYTGERVKINMKINEDTSQLIGDWEISGEFFGLPHHWLGSTADNNEARFNDDQVDADTIIKGMTDATLLFADASLDRIGIGTNAPADKLHVIGNFRFADGVGGALTKSMRFRTNGGDIDVEGAGKSIYLSVWSGAGYNGTQHHKLVLESGQDVSQAIGEWSFRAAPFGSENAVIDGVTGNATFNAVNGVDPAVAMGVVIHGSNASAARPDGYASVHWIGTVEPTNAINNDIWSQPA